MAFLKRKFNFFFKSSFWSTYKVSTHIFIGLFSHVSVWDFVIHHDGWTYPRDSKKSTKAAFSNLFYFIVRMKLTDKRHQKDHFSEV